MVELREVAAILDGGKIEEGDLQSALQALLFHQCLYEDWPYPPAYRIIARHFAQVQPIVAAFGYKLVHHTVASMLVLETESVVYGVNMARLKKDETVVLLILRLLYAENISSLDERGRVETNTDDLHDRLRSAGEEPPVVKRLHEILKFFQRKGLVRIGENDPEEQILQLSIMPGITMLVPDVYVEAVIQWLERQAFEATESGEVDTTSPVVADSMLGHVADHRANLGSETEAADAADEDDDEVIEDKSDV